MEKEAMVISGSTKREFIFRHLFDAVENVVLYGAYGW
jgi:hypothetical protein